MFTQMSTIIRHDAICAVTGTSAKYYILPRSASVAGAPTSVRRTADRSNISISSLLLDLNGLTGSAAGHRSIAPGFKPRLWYVRTLFHHSLGVINAGGRSAHLAYREHKSGRKTSTFTFLTICLRFIYPFI